MAEMSCWLLCLPKNVLKANEVMTAISKTPFVLASEIVLKSQNHSGFFFLLEGDFDQRFWESRLNSSHLKIINCVGKANVLGTLDLFNSQNTVQKIVALVDKDYDEIQGKKRNLPQLVYTDENDLEVTLLRCPKNAVQTAIEKILSQSVDSGKFRNFEASIGCTLVDNLRKMAANYGVLRLINEQLVSGGDFNKLSILHQEFLDHSTFTQDEAALQKEFIQELVRAGKVSISQDELNVKIEEHQRNGLFEEWALVQGHDLLKLLATAINSKILKRDAGHTSADESSLARDLCLMIHRQDLETTNMFCELSQKGSNVQLDFFVN
jgi:hypothetical protein